MSETEKKKDEIIKDGLSKAIKNSEAIAVQAVDSAAKVLKVGLDNAEDLTAKAGDILLIMSNGGFDNIHEKLLSAL